MAKFGVPSDRSLLKLLKELPDGPVSAVRGWFEVLSNIEDNARDKFINNILESYKRDEIPSSESISSELSALGMPTTRANDLAPWDAHYGIATVSAG
jgi:hypothetical protein